MIFKGVSLIVDTETSQLETDGNFDSLVKAGRDKKRKNYKKGDERGSTPIKS